MKLSLTVVFVLLRLCAVTAVYMWLFSKPSQSHISFLSFLQITMEFISIVVTVGEPRICSTDGVDIWKTGC